MDECIQKGRFIVNDATAGIIIIAVMPTFNRCDALVERRGHHALMAMFAHARLYRIHKLRSRAVVNGQRGFRSRSQYG